MIGIYKITNKINNKAYIGQSQDIIRRWKSHKYNAGKYTTLISKALSKYGINNFNFEVIEETSKEKLDEREQYWIDYYNTLSPNGYNCIDVNSVYSGEQNPNNKYSTQFIRTLRERVFVDNEPPKEVLEDYKDIMGRTYFYSILHGDFRKEDGSGIELVRNLVDRAGSKNARATINEQDVLNIRNRVYINNELMNIVWQDYKDVISWEAFTKACRGETWKNVDISMIHELKPERLGKPKAKITKQEVGYIRYRYEVLKQSINDIFNDYSDRVTKITIKRIVNYETWKDVKPVSTIPEA